jgi:hypothetical protein
MCKSKCYLCNKIIKYEPSILRNININKQNDKCNSTFAINVVCSDCFEVDNYINFMDHLNKNDANFDLFLNDRKIYILKREWSKYYKREKRREELNKRLKEMKLSCQKNSICTLYINNGKPDLETVINSLHGKKELETKRLYKLLKVLKKHNFDYDCKIPSYKKFIESGGDIEKTIKNAELEKALIDNTNYLSILCTVDSETARELSANDYISNNKKSNNAIENFISNKNTIVFE